MQTQICKSNKQKNVGIYQDDEINSNLENAWVPE